MKHYKIEHLMIIALLCRNMEEFKYQYPNLYTYTRKVGLLNFIKTFCER